LEFLTRNKAKLCKTLILSLVFEKRQFFRRKLQKIVIITSTPGGVRENITGKKGRRRGGKRADRVQVDQRPMLFFIFSPKKLAKKLAYLTQNRAKFCKTIDHNIGMYLRKTPIFFLQKLGKIA
jgi:hypothetical protein